MLISDVDVTHVWLESYFKVWVDHYSFIAEIKGSSVKIQPKRTFVTSNYKLDEIYSGEILSALQDHFDVYDNDTVLKRKPYIIKRNIMSALYDNELSFLSECQSSTVCENICMQIQVAEG